MYFAFLLGAVREVRGLADETREGSQCSLQQHRERVLAAWIGILPRRMLLRGRPRGWRGRARRRKRTARGKWGAVQAWVSPRSRLLSRSMPPCKCSTTSNGGTGPPAFVPSARRALRTKQGLYCAVEDDDSQTSWPLRYRKRCHERQQHMAKCHL